MKAFSLFSCMLFAFFMVHVTAPGQSAGTAEVNTSPGENLPLQEPVEALNSAAGAEKVHQQQWAEGEALPAPHSSGEGMPKKSSTAAEGQMERGFTGRSFLYYTDFTTDPPGAMPAAWFGSDSARVVELAAWPGRWLSLGRKGAYAPGAKLALPSTFTLEFDVLMFGQAEEGVGTFTLSLAAIEEENPTEAWRYLFTSVDMYVGWNYSTFTVEHAGRENKFHFANNILRQELGRPVHISLMVKEGRYTLWVNEQKVVDLPALLETGRRYNRLLLSTQLSKVEEGHQVLVSNILLSSGQEQAAKAKMEKSSSYKH